MSHMFKVFWYTPVPPGLKTLLSLKNNGNRSRWGCSSWSCTDTDARILQCLINKISKAAVCLDITQDKWGLEAATDLEYSHFHLIDATLQTRHKELTWFLRSLWENKTKNKSIIKNMWLVWEAVINGNAWYILMTRNTPIIPFVPLRSCL